MARVGRKAAGMKKGRPSGKRVILTTSVLLIALLIFVLAFAVRAFGILDTGITWDEPIYVTTALAYLSTIPAESILSPVVWQVNSEHPPIAKIIYAVAIGLLNGPNFGLGAFQVARYASVLMGALACVLTFLIGLVVYDRKTGILAGIVLALLPVAVAHSQIAGLESPLMFFFTLAVFLFVMGLKSGDRRMYAAAAVAAGLTIDTKLNGLLIVPVLALIFVCYLYTRKPSPVLKSLAKPALSFTAIVAATVVLLWPWLWCDFGLLVRDPLNHLLYTLNHWSYVPQEYFLGTYQSAPVYYLPVYFLLTTPLLVLALCLAGAYFSVMSRDGLKSGMLVWLLVPFAYGLSSFVQDGVRYVIVLFPAVALVAAYGLSMLVTAVRKKWPKIGDDGKVFLAAGGLLALYLVVSLFLVSPYYLDYYNEISGGQRNAQENRLLEVGWWGEGIKPCVEYVERSAPSDSIVLLATMPSDSMNFGPFTDHLVYLTLNTDSVVMYNFTSKKKFTMDNTAENQSYARNADYIIANSYFLEYGDSPLDLQQYAPVYSTSVGGATLCTVYRRTI